MNHYVLRTLLKDNNNQQVTTYDRHYNYDVNENNGNCDTIPFR